MPVMKLFTCLIAFLFAALPAFAQQPGGGTTDPKSDPGVTTMENRWQHPDHPASGERPVGREASKFPRQNIDVPGLGVGKVEESQPLDLSRPRQNRSQARGRSRSHQKNVERRFERMNENARQRDRRLERSGL